MRLLTLGTIKLSSQCTVSQYCDLVRTQDKIAISEFLEQRFLERYLDPVTVDCKKKNGFSIMAVACLMIEALECFAQGLPNSNRASRQMFVDFFNRYDHFLDFRPIADEFYVHIRCGILHQAETTGGWRVTREGPLLCNKKINATRFERELRTALQEYCSKLKSEEWGSQTWEAFRVKMDSVCANAQE